MLHRNLLGIYPVHSLLLHSGTHDLLYVKKVLEPVTARWKNIGLALRLDPGELEDIETRHKKLDNCLTEVLCLWLSKKYDTENFEEPSWGLLADVVAYPAGGNNKALAMDIDKEHC